MIIALPTIGERFYAARADFAVRVGSIDNGPDFLRG
jgi:hypothetical protein